MDECAAVGLPTGIDKLHVDEAAGLSFIKLQAAGGLEAGLLEL